VGVTVGDTVLFRVLRGWVAAHRHSSDDTALFIALAEAAAGKPMSGFFTAWLDTPQLPDLPESAVSPR
jgi:aminopeptidase N